MNKSNNYSLALSTLLGYYYNELINNNDEDPIRTITTDFINMLELNAKQQQFVEDEANDLGFTLYDYITNIIKIINLNKNNLGNIKKEEIEFIEVGLELIKTKLVIKAN